MGPSSTLNHCESACCHTLHCFSAGGPGVPEQEGKEEPNCLGSIPWCQLLPFLELVLLLKLKIITAEPDAWSSVPRTHTVEGQTPLLKAVL